MAEKAEATTDPTTMAPETTSESDWKAELDKNLTEWQKESAIAREKSESTRKRLEDEKSNAAKAAAEEKKQASARARKQREDEDVERQVEALLRSPSSKQAALDAKASRVEKEETEQKRWNAVRNAWEVVRVGSESETPAVVAAGGGGDDHSTTNEPQVEVDSRDLTAGDQGGVSKEHEKRGPEVLKASFDLSHSPLLFLFDGFRSGH